MQKLKEISEKIGLLILDFISYIEQEDGIKKFKNKFLQLTDSIPDEKKNKSLEQLQDKIVDFLEKLESESYKSQDEYEELTEQVSESLEEFEIQLDTGVSGEQTDGSTSENESVPEDASAEEEQEMTLDDSDFAADLELINDFIEESRENLENAELNLVELEKEPMDKEKINTVFRTFHTMKGVAGFLGFGKIVEIAHNTEDLLDEIRNGNISLDNEIFDLLFQMVDVHKDSIAELQKGLNRFCEVHNETHHYSTQKGMTPKQRMEYLNYPLHRLDDDYHFTQEPLPLERGEIYVIRFIRSDLNFNIFGLSFILPEETKYEYIKGVIITNENRLIIFKDQKYVTEFQFFLYKSLSTLLCELFLTKHSELPQGKFVHDVVLTLEQLKSVHYVMLFIIYQLESL